MRPINGDLYLGVTAGIVCVFVTVYTQDPKFLIPTLLAAVFLVSISTPRR